MAAKGFRQAGHTPSLIASLIHFDVSFMVWVLIGVLGVYVSEDLGLTPAQKGLMVAVPPLGGSVFRLILGPIADRRGSKRTGLVTMALVAIPLTVGWLAGTSYWQVLCIGAGLGIAGASFAVALPLASRWYPPEYQGLALGIAGAGNSGTIIAALVAPRVAEHTGWHGVFGLALIPVSLAWIAFAVLAKEPPRPAAAAKSSIFSLLREPDARWLCGFYLVTFGGYVGLSGYLSIFFHDQFDISKVDAAGLTALCASAGSFLRPVGGAFADRVGGTRVLAVVLTIVAGLVAYLATLPALVPTVVVLFMVMGGLGIGNGAVFQLVPLRFPERVGALTGLVGAAGGVGGFLLPFGMGALNSATGTFTLGFVVFASAAISAGIGVGSRQRVWSRSWQLTEASI